MNTKLSNTQILLQNFHYRIEELKKDEAVDPLCLDETIELDIQLTTGGPADGFKIYLNKETRESISGVYYYSEWGWYKEENLHNDELELVIEKFGVR